jgi:hypothetical protein
MKSLELKRRNVRHLGAIGAAAVVATGVVFGGCVYRRETVPAASPPTTVIVSPSPAPRIVTHPGGRYELYGDGTTTPYYWVWMPAGSTAPVPPPPPPLPR